MFVDDDECNLEKTSLINCTEHPIMHRTGGCVLVPRTHKMLAMENVKIQGLSELSLDLRPSSVIFS